MWPGCLPTSRPGVTRALTAYSSAAKTWLKIIRMRKLCNSWKRLDKSRRGSVRTRWARDNHTALDLENEERLLMTLDLENETSTPKHRRWC